MAPGPPTYREIVFAWLPLALSRLMMAFAGPISNAGIARLPDATVNLAAYGLILDIAVLIESPIIMILSASVALVRDRNTYLLLRRFLLHMTAVLTLISFLVAFTPLYDVILLRVIGAPAAVAEAARPGLRVMLLWPLAIGWRRLFQGILILHNRNSRITYATLFRLGALTVTITVSTWLGVFSGALMGGLALVISVLVEMVVIYWWTRPLIRTQILPTDAGDHSLSYRSLARFYAPLAGTETMRVVSRPVTTAGIARTTDPTLSLAAWPVAYSAAWLISGAAMALPEVVLALARDEASQRRLRWFALGVGLGLTALLGLLAFTPLADWYFGALLDIPAAVQPLTVQAVRLMVILPLLFAGRDFLRGVLIRLRRSNAVQGAMASNLLMLILLLSVGVWLGQIVGALLAALATVAAYLFEVLVLRTLLQRQPQRSASAHDASGMETPTT